METDMPNYNSSLLPETHTLVIPNNVSRPQRDNRPWWQKVGLGRCACTELLNLGWGLLLASHVHACSWCVCSQVRTCRHTISMLHALFSFTLTQSFQL